MANSRPYRYGGTLVDNASVEQFVMGVQARDDAIVKTVGKMAAAGIATALAVTAYQRRRR